MFSNVRKFLTNNKPKRAAWMEPASFRREFARVRQRAVERHHIPLSASFPNLPTSLSSPWKASRTIVISIAVSIPSLLTTAGLCCTGALKGVNDIAEDLRPTILLLLHFGRKHVIAVSAFFVGPNRQKSNKFSGIIVAQGWCLMTSARGLALSLHAWNPLSKVQALSSNTTSFCSTPSKQEEKVRDSRRLLTKKRPGVFSNPSRELMPLNWFDLIIKRLPCLKWRKSTSISRVSRSI